MPASPAVSPEDQTPPMDIEAEEYVLGACLISEGAIDATREIIEPADFGRPGHGLIYQALLDLKDRGDPVSIITLTSELTLCGDIRKAGGKTRLHQLASIVPAAANAPHYARMVVDKRRARDMLDTGLLLQKAAYNGGFASHPELADRIREITNGVAGRGLNGLDLAELLAGPVPETAWVWQEWIAVGDVCLLVGDPKVGKSLVALGLANASRQGKPFLGADTAASTFGIFDLENPLTEIHKRLRRIGLTSADHDGFHYFHMPQLSLITPAGMAQFRSTLIEHEIDVAVIDSFRRVAPGVEENDSAAISRFFQPLRHLTATMNLTIIVIHHARKRTGADQDSSAGQMTRGSGDFIAAVDSQLYLRRKEAGLFTMEHGASRRGLEHDPIQVRVSKAEDEHLLFTNEGPAIIAESKMDTMLIKILHTLREAGGGPITSTVLSLKLGVSPKEKRSFYNALNLGFEKNWLAKAESNDPRKPTEWSLTEETW